MVPWVLPMGSMKSHTQISPGGGGGQHGQQAESDGVGEGGEAAGQLGGLGVVEGRSQHRRAARAGLGHLDHILGPGHHSPIDIC